MATQWLIPNGDGSVNTWTLAGAPGDYYTVIDDAILPPNDSSGENLQCTAVKISEIAYTTITAAAITSIVVYVSCSEGGAPGSPNIDVDIYMDGGWLGDKNIIPEASSGWKNTTAWTGSWDQADINAIQTRITGHPDGGIILVYEIDVLVTYSGGATTRSHTLV